MKPPVVYGKHMYTYSVILYSSLRIIDALSLFGCEHGHGYALVYQPKLNCHMISQQLDSGIIREAY